MSTEAIADQAARLSRALRLEDVLINAGAVPLPVDLTPSMTSLASSDNSEALLKEPDASSSPDDGAQAQVQPPVPTIADHAALNGEINQDAIVTSLQATRDAIHDSLKDAGVGRGAATQILAAQVSGEDGQSPSPPLTHESVHIPNAAGDPDVADSLHASAVSALAPTSGVEQDVETIVNHAWPLVDLDLANGASTLVADQKAAVASPLDHSTGTTNGDLFGPVGSAGNAASNPQHDVQSIATSVTQPVVNDTSAVAGSALHTILNPASNVSPVDLATSVAHAIATTGDAASSDVSALEHVGDVAGATTAMVAPSPATGSVADAVTVPSLQGVGFDALVGLLQPSSTASDSAHAATANPAHLGFDDTSLLVPIGLDDVVHSDSGVTHAIHSSLPPAGSGLI